MDLVFFAIVIFSLGYVLSLFAKMHFFENYLFTMCISADKKGKDILLGYGVELVNKPLWKPMWFVEWKVRRRLKFPIEGKYDEVFHDIKYHKVEDGEWVIEDV